MTAPTMQCATVHSLVNAHSHITNDPHTLPRTLTRSIGLKELANGVLDRKKLLTLPEQSNVHMPYALVIKRWMTDIDEKSFLVYWKCVEPMMMREPTLFGVPPEAMYD